MVVPPSLKMVDQGFQFPLELEAQGAMIVENRFMHILIAYILVQRNTNNTQPTGNDMKLMYVVKEGIMINLSETILKVMFGIASSSSRLLSYGIFISCVIEHAGINISNEEVIVANPIEHLIDDSLIHNMNIYKYGGVWMYQEDYQKTIDIIDEVRMQIQLSKTKHHNVMRLLIYLKNHILFWLTCMPWNNALMSALII
ncbi:hypothetical protein Lal_00012408 [Lupinus albus]|nr:hypothetical protein Lal_00012408 [Lupinus albus]